MQWKFVYALLIWKYLLTIKLLLLFKTYYILIQLEHNRSFNSHGILKMSLHIFYNYIYRQ